MELLPLVCLCLLTWSGTTFADGNGPGVVTVAVAEGSEAVLPCSLSTRQNIEQKVFDWKKDVKKEVFLYAAGQHYNKGRTGQDEQFKGRVFHFEDELKNGNASIKIHNTKMADSGSYTCTFPNTAEPESHVKLVVGAAPKPSITTLDEANDWALLQCEGQGKPKPHLQWQDTSGNNLTAEEPQVSEREGRFYVILQTTVTKTGRYRCVATQEEINHQIYAETYVHMSDRREENNSESQSGTVVGVAVSAALGTLFVVGIVLAVLRTKGYKFNKDPSTKTRVPTEDSSHSGQHLDQDP